MTLMSSGVIGPLSSSSCYYSGTTKMATMTLLPLLLISLSTLSDVLLAAELSIKPVGESHTKALGSNIVFTCEILAGNDKTDYSLKWFDSKNAEITERAGKVYIEDESSSSKKLYITGIETKDAGKYLCTAVIDRQKQQRPVSLLPFQDIEFKHAPSIQHPSINSSALIECRVSGSLTVSWRYKGKRLESADGRYAFEKDGLRIKHITKADDGEYTCRAEVEIDGRYDERKITVIVHIPPTITGGPPTLTSGVEGETVTIRCNATGLPPPTYEFVKDNNASPIQKSERITVDNDLGEIKFKPVKQEDAGRYTCKAINSAGKKEASGTLKVHVRAQIAEFKSTTQTEGQQVKLVCLSRGDPAPNMTFVKAAKPGSHEKPAPYKLGENNDGRVIVRSTPGRLELTIASSLYDDAGNYTCISHNNFGHNESTALLTVNFRPRFMASDARHAYIWPGKTTNLSCNPLAEPAPSIEWTKQKRILENNDTNHIYMSDRNSTLQVRMRDAGQNWIYDHYLCKATNEFGTKELSIEVRPASPPKAPTNINVTEVQPNRITFNVLTNSLRDDLPILGYRVQYNDILLQDIEQANGIQIENLKPSTSYRLTVRSKNEVGVGSPIVKNVTTAAVRKPYPLAITSNAIGNSGYEYHIQWATPSTGGLPIQQYEFKYKKVKDAGDKRTADKASEEWKIVVVADDPTNPIVDYHLTGLEHETSYELQIKIKNENGWSDDSRAFTFQTIKATAEEVKRATTAKALVATLVVVVIIIVLLIIIDVSCFFAKFAGVTACLCNRVCGRTEPCGKQSALEQGDGSKEVLKEPLAENNQCGGESAPAAIPAETAVAVEETTKEGKEEGKCLLANDHVTNKVEEDSKDELKKEIKQEEADNKTDDQKVNDDPVVITTVPTTDNNTSDATANQT